MELKWHCGISGALLMSGNMAGKLYCDLKGPGALSTLKRLQAGTVRSERWQAKSEPGLKHMMRTLWTARFAKCFHSFRIA